MRSYLCIFATFLIVQLSQAQTDSTRKDRQFGLTVSTSATTYYSDLYCSPMVTYRMKKHQLEVGPKFPLPKDSYYKRQIGADIIYRYYPNGIKNRFNLYFLLNTGYWYRLVERSTYYFPGNIPATQRIKYNDYSFNVGYGFDLNLFKGLYLGTSISAGALYHSSHQNTTADDGSDLHNNTSKSSDPMVMVNLHFGYRF